MFRPAFIIAAIFGGLLLSAASAVPARAQAVTGVTMTLPQPLEGTVAQGLKVRYYYHLFRHIDELVNWREYDKGEAGAPLTGLNYRNGDEYVLTSKAADGVGAHIVGMIYLADPGLYAFATQSNDGVRVSLGGKMIIDDPDVHSDRYSDPVEVEIATAGWYPIEVLYFERKVTATLRLFWLQPDEEEGSMTVVPPEVFAYPK